ncbi:MAG: sel1 repeat family protein [Candidatus Paracaedibacteraceae bacterium]|nr:sel1 repeat family protein [Candidatus Paracaedibacteraceae bacterium]
MKIRNFLFLIGLAKVLPIVAWSMEKEGKEITIFSPAETEFEVCETITGRKEHVPLQKAAYFKNSMEKIREISTKGASFTAKDLTCDEDLIKWPAHHYYMLGELYLEGIQNEPDHEEAAYYYQQAFKLGHQGARLRMGLSYEEGIMVDRDPEKAANLYRGYEGGWMNHHRCSNSTEALYYLGRHFAVGYDQSKKEKMKIELLSRAAEHGHEQALFELGKAYYRATGDRKNFPKAIECLEKAGDLGRIKAYYWLGKAFYCEGDISHAVEFFKKAVEKDFNKEWMMNVLSEIYLQYYKDNNYLQDAVDLLTEASNQGECWAQYRLGRMYLKGFGVLRVPAIGINYLKQAIQNPRDPYAHSERARTYLGIAYYKGKEIGKNDREASKLLDFEENHLLTSWGKRAYFYKLRMNYEGCWCKEFLDLPQMLQGVTPESILAQLEDLAKDKNYAKAQFYLAQILLKGEKANKNEEKAITLLRDAAGQGHTKALSMLQSMGKDCSLLSQVSKPSKVNRLLRLSESTAESQGYNG